MTNLWITPEELVDVVPEEFSYEACKAASGMMWALSGRKYSGISSTSEWYVTQADTLSYGGASSSTYSPILVDGSVVNVPSDRIDVAQSMTTDGITTAGRIKLRGRPVRRIDAVRDTRGNILDPESYYLTEYSVLQCRPGHVWSDSAVEVTYAYGTYPPTMGKMAARQLAIELAKLWAGDDDCALPQRVTSVARQGVTFTVLDPQDFIDDLRTGIYSIDLFLKSVNPDKARNRSRVFSPDTFRARRAVSKPLTYAPTATDLIVNGAAGAERDIALSALSAAFLTNPEWTTQLIIHSNGNNRSLDLGASAAVVNVGPSTITLSVSYADANAVLGTVDPGTWDLYASRPSTVVIGETETVYIASGNLYIQMASNTINAYNIV